MFLKNRRVRSCGLLLVLLCLLSLLTACGASSSQADLASGTVLGTSTNTAQYVKFTKSYSFSIRYPKTWEYKIHAKDVYTFSNLNGVAFLTVQTLKNIRDDKSSEQVMNQAFTTLEQQPARLNLYQSNTSYQLQKLTRISGISNVTAGGKVWIRQNATAMMVVQAQSTPIPVTLTVLTTNHPKNSFREASYTVIYLSASDVYASAQTGIFQPMLETFIFNVK